MDEMRRRTNRTDSGWSSTSSKSSSSIPSVFRTRSVPSWEKQAIEEERAARPPAYQWKCPRYNLTWAELEQHLRRKFPNETFYEFQSGDYWIFNAPEKQTPKDLEEFVKLRPRPQPQPHQHPQQLPQQQKRRAKSPE